jgi:uncharacterized protein with beta-barrel porin domain
VGASRDRRALKRRVASAALAAALGVAATAAHAQDAQWVGGGAPTANEWLQDNNWNPATTPTGTATFDTSTTTAVSVGGFATIGAVDFTATASTYTITTTDVFVVNGAGVSNAAAAIQTFDVQSSFVFLTSASASAGTGVVKYTVENGGSISFTSSSTAGNANIVNAGDVEFNNTSTAATSTITNNAVMNFQDTSAAGSATITNGATGSLSFNSNSTAGSATITNNSGGTIDFNNSSTAGTSQITNNSGGTITFHDTTTASTATITNSSGGSVAFNDTSTAGSAIIGNAGTLAFNDTSTAGTASILANSGAITFNNSATGGSASFTSGGLIDFHDTSTAGTASASYTNTGSITFHDSSTAGAAGFTNNIGGTITFNDTSTAGSATFTNNAALVFNNSADAGTATITGSVGSSTTFNNGSTANAAHITNSGTLTFNNLSTAGTATITNNDVTIFNNVATAGSASITNHGGIAFNNSATAENSSILNDGTLTFNQSATAGNATITTNASTVFNGVSSGGTARFITNPGGSVDFSGLTSGGTTAGSIEGGGNYVLGPNTLTVGNNNLSTTVSGSITSGGGDLVKVGTGTLTLAGINGITGSTVINGGTLSITGSALGSPFFVNSGGTLNGTGSVGAITVNSGGTLMPGLPASVGTLHVSNNVQFNSGATYQILIQGATNSQTQATGTATLNSGAAVNIASGSTINVNQKYTILTAAGGVSGQFNPNVTFGAFKGTLSYDANDVFLTFSFTNLAPLLPPGAPINVVNVANAIDNFVAGGGMLPPGLANLAMLSQSQLEGALTQLSGELGTGAQRSSFQLMNQFMSLLLDPLADGHGDGIGPLPFAPDRPQTTFTPEVANAYASVLKAPAAPIPVYGPWRAWGAAFGGANSITGDPVIVGSHDVRTTAGGFAAGLDYRASPDTVLGLALAGAATGWDLSAGLGSGHSDAFQAGLYAKHQFGQAYLSGALAFANYWASTSRVVTVAGTDTLKASFDAQSFGGRLEGGYRVSFAPFTLTPYAAAQAQSFRLPGYSETAASGSPQFALSYAGQTSTATRAELGSWLSHNVLLAGGDTAVLFGRLAWAHDWFSHLAVTPSFQALPGASFVVNGAAPPHDLALVTAGAEWRLRSNWSLMGRFDGEFGDGAQTYTGTARVRYAW